MKDSSHLNSTSVKGYVWENKYVSHNLRLVESAGAKLCIQRANCKVTGAFSVKQRVGALKPQCCSRVDYNFIQI